MTDKAMDDLDAVRTIFETLKNFKAEEQQRILRWVVEKTGLAQNFLASSTGASSATTPSLGAVPPVTPPSAQAATASGGVDIKSFIDEKQPRSDVQFAATVAYYLRFEAPATERKEFIDKEDLQEACRKAKRDRLNPHHDLLLRRRCRAGARSAQRIP